MMTLEQVRDWHLKQVDDALAGGWESDYMGNKHQHMADAIDAHLAPREVSDEDLERAIRASGDAIGGDYEGMRAALQADRQRGG